jgi:sugar lactone lactonase YvrE
LRRVVRLYAARMIRPATRSFVALAVAGALLALLAPPVSAARPLGETRVFARVPSPGQPEGILVRNGVVYVGTHTSMRGNAGEGPSRIFRYDLESGKPIGEFSIQGQNLSAVHGLVGMAWGPDSRLYVADRNPPRVLAIDFYASPPTQTTYATFPNLPRCSSAPPPCAPSTNPGDSLVDGLAFDRKGVLYVSDVQKATIFRVRPGGGLGAIWFQDPRLDGPFGVNGLAIEPNGARLFLAVTISNPPDSAVQGSIYTLPLSEQPRPGDLSLLHRFPEPMACPDGILFGRSGRLYAALACANQISILNPEGTELARFPTAEENARQEIPWDTPASLFFDGRGSLLVTNQSYVNAIPEHWAVMESWVDDTPL